jgi:hypothetical protein
MYVIQAQAGGIYLPNAQYNVLWNVTVLDRGCAAPVAGSATQKSFASPPAKKYGFTLYFTPGNCPPKGTDVHWRSASSSGKMNERRTVQKFNFNWRAKVRSRGRSGYKLMGLR